MEVEWGVDSLACVGDLHLRALVRVGQRLEDLHVGVAVGAVRDAHHEPEDSARNHLASVVDRLKLPHSVTQTLLNLSANSIEVLSALGIDFLAS